MTPEVYSLNLLNMMWYMIMPHKIDLKGVIFGRLEVIQETSKAGSHRCHYKCRCTCGKEVVVRRDALRRGDTKSCGCLNIEKVKESNTSHGLTGHALYKVWNSMKSRCGNPNSSSYKNYGGRGIFVCDKWRDSFENFYEDVRVGYKENLELDRIDNNKGYSKDNCRWVTRSQNSYNKGSKLTSTSEYKGVSYCKSRNRWEAKIQKDTKKYNLGRYACEKEAALAYNKKAKELFGEYAYLNKIED